MTAIPILPKPEHECHGMVRGFVFMRNIIVETSPPGTELLYQTYKEMALYYCPHCREEFGVWVVPCMPNCYKCEPNG